MDDINILTVRIPREDKSRLMEYAKTHDCSASQIIRYSSSHRVGLKHFYLSSTYDYFLYYEDGIHKITKEKYLDFSRGMKIDMMFNRTNGSIYMLKNQGVYLFIFKMKDKLYLLNGGKLHKLEKDCLEYYFDRMVFYS